MTRSSSSIVPRALAWACAAMIACNVATDDVAPTEERAAAAEGTPMQAKRITIDVHELSNAQITALGEHIEGIGEVSRAQIKVKQDDDGATSVLIEVAGNHLPTDAELTQEVESFPGMADALVTVHDVPPGEVGPGPAHGDLDNKTPEQIRAEVTERLAAQGIEGEVVVEVSDDGDGERRVEVRVEATDAPVD